MQNGILLQSIDMIRKNKSNVTQYPFLPVTGKVKTVNRV